MVTVDGFDALTAEAGKTELVRASGMVEALREVKDAGEVALLRLACEAADAALTDLIERGGLRPGRTEREVSRELEALMLDHGADGVSFDTIVAAGANSAIPHHRPTDAVLATGDFVKIDFGALVAGYHSDMTRTFVLGRAADWQRRSMNWSPPHNEPGARRCGRARTCMMWMPRPPSDHRRRPRGAFRPRPGARGRPADPRSAGINATAVGTLLAGSVVTVEPGVYLPDRGGVRIEDTLVVADETSGHTPELLTRFPKELAIL
ncbi:metallopeptidase M24 family protein [Mycobacterium xenopi 4042]|uniref:Metallopeptidase M24 family protein n=1 Tax=Mycobacterium xenopi 4042 TaxID=1299334 RepID=X7ZWX2_MYCXE|nr:metallopeptidase M24 family protein [Mycobacterium xenopi 4042]